MKALIVDDELHVRDAINLLANWQKHGITEVLQASNGEEAMDIIERYSPQIVMTDMRMPRKDGCELLSWLQAHRPDIKALVISGYDDFQLVRHAIRHGGLDYILKPVEPGALDEALNKAVSAWRNEEQSRQQVTRLNIEMNQMKPLYDDQLLTDLVTGHNTGKHLLVELQERSLIPASITYCTAAVLSNAHFDEQLQQKFRNRRHLLDFALINICSELLKNTGIAFRNLDKPGEIVILYWGQSRPLNAVLEDINSGMNNTLHRRAHFGISKREVIITEIPRAYAEATDALWSRDLLNSESYIHEEAPRDHAGIHSLRNTPQEEKFRLAAFSGAAEQMESAAQQWIDEIFTSRSLSLKQLLEWIKEWDSMPRHWSEQDTASNHKAIDNSEVELPSISLPLNEYGLLDREYWRRQIVSRLLAASRMLIHAHSKDIHIIHDIAKYLEQHYSEEISLQDISSRFFLSREYISRKFKQEFGVTVLDYLSSIRIEKAKLLLMNPHLRIIQVAEMVGYHDEKYFSKVFKKLEGRTPNDYRKEYIL
ncbi:response regulator [Paenibacillus motobuensis]|uniref:DNA-binding response regulator n=1 Tax=Paenibacillus motobuensis TaxID=295324 RepID=A0ABN0YR01_9BACL